VEVYEEEMSQYWSCLLWYYPDMPLSNAGTAENTVPCNNYTNYAQYDIYSNQWEFPGQLPSQDTWDRIQTQISNSNGCNTVQRIIFDEQLTNYINPFQPPLRIEKYANNTGGGGGSGGGYCNVWVTPDDINANSKAYKIKDVLMKIFAKPNKKLWKEMTEDEKKLFRAKQASEKLLKSWLIVEEWKGLKYYGELEIKSKLVDDCIYIVKRDPHAMVEVKKNGNYSHKLCVISKDGDMPVGDQLLSKLLLLKNDEEKFVEIAIRHR
jgi:hypothetical protein